MYQNIISFSYTNISMSHYMNGNSFLSLSLRWSFCFSWFVSSVLCLFWMRFYQLQAVLFCYSLFFPDHLWWYYLTHVQLAHIEKVQTSAVLPVHQLKTVFWSENFQLVMLLDNTLLFRYEIKEYLICFNFIYCAFQITEIHLLKIFNQQSKFLHSE